MNILLENHPLNSLCGLGPMAEGLIAEQKPLDVYGPYKKMYADDNAYIVLAGVDLTKSTPIHFAEEKSGRQLFRRWGLSDNQKIESEVGSCSNGFENLRPVVKDIETEIVVGCSTWRVYPFRTFINMTVQAMHNDPQITHCENRQCTRCNDAIKGGPILER